MNCPGRDHNSVSVRGAGALCVCCVVIAMVWLVVLPAITSRTGADQYLSELESRGIDPAATFYTELDWELLTNTSGRHPKQTKNRDANQ